MNKEIYSAFNAKQYKVVKKIFETVPVTEHDIGSYLPVAHSYRILGDYDKAVKIYRLVVDSNKSDKRSSFHALQLILKNGLDNDLGFYFADSLIQCQSLAFEESVLLLKFCFIKDYKVTAVNEIISSMERRYEIMYAAFSDLNGDMLLLKSKYFDFNRFNYSVAINELSGSESIFFLLLLDLFMTDGISSSDLRCILNNLVKGSLWFVDEIALLSLLKNFYSLSLAELKDFFSILKPSRTYPVIYNSFSKRRVCSEKFKLLISYVKSKIEYQSGIELSKKAGFDNRIAIVVPAFLDSRSSYVKFIRDYVLSIKKVNHAAEIKIFVTDELNLDISSLSFGYKSSQQFRSRHREIFNQEGLELFEKGVDIWYSDGPNSDTYIEDFVSNIFEFSPSSTLSFSAYGSLFFSDFLYGNYPFIFIQTNVKDSPNYSADVYLTFYENVSEVSQGKPFPSRWFHQKSPYVELGNKIRLSKLDYLNYDYQFVMVTVGARLSKELTHDFSCRILDFISENNMKDKSIGWLIIGDFDRKEIISLAKERNVDRNLVFKSYENNLASAYGICDIYLNPERTGGGISIAYAISAGIPAMCFVGADASPFVGEDMLFSSIDQYIAKLDYFFSNTNKLKESHVLQHKKLQDNHSLTAVGRSLVSHIKNAVFSFERRLKGDDL